MSRTFPQTAAALAGLAALSVLAGCGKQGNLERPGPMFGHATAAPGPAQRQDPNRPVQTIDPRDPNYIPQDQPASGAPPAPTPQP